MEYTQKALGNCQRAFCMYLLKGRNLTHKFCLWRNPAAANLHCQSFPEPPFLFVSALLDELSFLSDLELLSSLLVLLSSLLVEELPLSTEKLSLSSLSDELSLVSFFSDFELSLLFDLLSVELPASFLSSLRLAVLELLSLPAEESSLSSLPVWLEKDDEDEEDESFFVLLADDREELELLFLVLPVFLSPQPVSMVRVISAARAKAPTFCHLVFCCCLS